MKKLKSPLYSKLVAAACCAPMPSFLASMIFTAFIDNDPSSTHPGMVAVSHGLYDQEVLVLRLTY